MGTAGSDEDARLYAERFSAYRTKPFPMPALAPSYIDKWFARKLAGKTIQVDPDHADIPAVPLAVTTVPHAINSVHFEGRPPCDGRGACVPFCPTGARYEAAIHVEKARRAGAKLIPKAMVWKLTAGPDNRISEVVYRSWDRQDHAIKGRVVVLAANAVEIPK